MPICDRKTHMLRHRFPVEYLLRIIMTKSQRAFRLCAFEGDRLDAREMDTVLFHSRTRKRSKKAATESAMNTSGEAAASSNGPNVLTIDLSRRGSLRSLLYPHE